MTGHLFSLEIRPQLPQRLHRLEELSLDLYYSWERDVRGLFRALDAEAWDACNHSPRVFLRRVSQEKLEAAARDLVFVENYNRVLSAYDTYIREKPKLKVRQAEERDLGTIAFFCAEYGFHESFPIYSGGLGILAGDYCKAMSDAGLSFVAVGLLYRQGYFTQRIGPNGEQMEEYPCMGPEDLPVNLVLDAEGRERRVVVKLPGRTLQLRLWSARVGHIQLIALDSDVVENQEGDRNITYQLYGGDRDLRLKQEMVLGIGGVRALRALGIEPGVWHLNEGHAAFVVLERCLELVTQGLGFSAALEAVAAGMVFTSHTPVSAGHDVYDLGHIRHYFSDFASLLGLDIERLLDLGRDPAHPQGFNMTSLGLRGSRFHNGVSRINGQVASAMNGYVWPEIPAEENPFGYVTNGIHVPSFLGPAWIALFDMYFGRGWRSRLDDRDYWRLNIDRIPEHVFISAHRVLKAEMLEDLRRRMVPRLQRNGVTEPRIRRMTRYLDPDHTGVLTIGFARRFATYKRATLVFRDLERLGRLLNDPQRPLVFIFAGKAHPSDEPGKQLLREIHHIAQRPEFEGKILLLENYNLSLALRLLPGVDVWLNTPRYPMEACGTSGMKAGINGVLNLSLLDGWWAEAYEGTNGWAISSHEGGGGDSHDWQEANELLDILEYEVIPLYYANGGHGDSPEWIRRSKASMQSVLPHYNTERMLADYLCDYYEPASRQNQRLCRDGCQPAQDLASWKEKIKARWDGVRLHLAEPLPQGIAYGEILTLTVDVELNGLEPNDISLECVFGSVDELGRFLPQSTARLLPMGSGLGERVRFRTELDTLYSSLHLVGLRHFKLRAYPHHKQLSHPFEVGCMRWL